MKKEHFIPIKYINGRWKADYVRDHKIVTQLRKEAGLKDVWPDVKDETYDLLLSAASKHGLGLETNG